jgi:hypothetical protein
MAGNPRPKTAAPPAARSSASGHTPRLAVVLAPGKYDAHPSETQLALLSGPPSVRRRNSKASATRPAPAPSKSASMGINIRPRVADEPRWDKNAWNQGRAMRSSGGFDEVRSGASLVRRNRLKRNRNRSYILNHK